MKKTTRRGWAWMMAVALMLACLAGCGEQGASSGAAATSSSASAGSTAANGDELTTTTDAIGTTDANSTDAIGTDGTTDADTAEGTTATGTSGASKTSTTKKPATTTKKPTTTTKKPTQETTRKTDTALTKTTIVWEEVERLVVQYINEYRIAQGDTPATVLPGLTEVARYRSKQLVTNFSHDTKDEREAFAYFQYGEYVDATLWGAPAENSYYDGASGEAIGTGGTAFFATNETLARQIADGFYNSKNHWRYLGSSKNPYIAVGITQDNEREFKTWDWFCCILVSDTNYG